MSEIYWLSRLDGVLAIFGIICTISVVSAVFMSLVVMIDREGETFMPQKKSKKLLRCCIITALITGIACVFVPSSKQAYMIFGIGRVVDYIQESEMASQLPDKCVEALEVWLESLTEEE